MAEEYVIGVDAGTGSVRAGLFNLSGQLIAHSSQDIRIWNPKEKYFQQSSEDIWAAVGHTVKSVLSESGTSPEAIIGISYDATCSLVALDAEDQPVSVSPNGEQEQNIVVWMDHRAEGQAERINATGEEVLKYVGGKLSPEQEPPKLLWLKENLADSWKKTDKFLDLTDFLTYKSTGIDQRSVCTTACKWTYLAHESKWDADFFETIDLPELLEEQKIGDTINPPGQLIGTLSDQAAADLGLTTQTKVATGIIDAHAGAIGVLGLEFDSEPAPEELEKILAFIGGTSSCHLAVSKDPKFIPGVWGPYYDALLPDLWLTEGGQSTSGSLVDYIITENSRHDEIQEKANQADQSVYDFLNDKIYTLQQEVSRGPEIVKDIHILPYFLGNRSPIADPSLKGVITGLVLDNSINSVAKRYYAAIQAVAYGTRHIIEEMNNHGYQINTIHATGGGTKNPLWLQEHADITGCTIILPEEPEAVLLGSAILAAVGAGKYQSILQAAVEMSSTGKRYTPQSATKEFHDTKYKVFRKMYEHYREYQDIMSEF